MVWPGFRWSSKAQFGSLSEEIEAVLPPSFSKCPPLARALKSPKKSSNVVVALRVIQAIL